MWVGKYSNINGIEFDSQIKYVIRDMLGEKIIEGILTEKQISLKSLSNGIYILELKGEENIFVSEKIAIYR